jgi:hypothetical protein
MKTSEVCHIRKERRCDTHITKQKTQHSTTPFNFPAASYEDSFSWPPIPTASNNRDSLKAVIGKFLKTGAKKTL